jgi:AcrR family transcriptional regulator
MPSDVNVVDELDPPDLGSPDADPPDAGPPPGPGGPDRARRRGSKGEQTRQAIAEAALRLFREHGYEATTMRAIAKEAGVATGNAYYYFGSKEELIHAYYARNHTEHAAACRAVLDTETRLDRRISGVLRALIDVQAPYHSFAAKLYKHAAEPLYWVHDASPGCEKTYRLIDVTAPLAERLVRLARLPVLRSMTRRLLAVLDEVLG